jgi:hypothetical protein
VQEPTLVCRQRAANLGMIGQQEAESGIRSRLAPEVGEDQRVTPLIGSNGKGPPFKKAPFV